MLKQPRRIPLALRPFIFLAEKIAGKKLLPARILSRSPRIALVSGIAELGIEKAAAKVGRRTAGLVRIQTSYTLNCPFCIDMNVAAYRKAGITRDEVMALRNSSPGEAGSFSSDELLLLQYVRRISETPLNIPPELIRSMEERFGSDATLRIAALSVKVNYWARLIQSLGIPPAGYMDACDIPGPET